MEFGEQLTGQWTVQAQEQQQELVEKVLATQAKNAERHKDELASVKIEFGQELDRTGKVSTQRSSDSTGCCSKH